MAESKKYTTRICKYCGKPFLPGKKNQQYCCAECGYEGQKKERRELTAQFSGNGTGNKKIGYAKYLKGCRLTLDSTLAKCEKSGKTFAEQQIEKTFKLIEPIDLNI